MFTNGVYPLIYVRLSDDFITKHVDKEHAKICFTPNNTYLVLALDTKENVFLLADDKDQFIWISIYNCLYDRSEVIHHTMDTTSLQHQGNSMKGFSIPG